jgi:hypothetical protein
MIGSLMMCVSVVILLIGILAGVAMGVQENFTLQPAHAHLNLVGGVLLFLFGLYYRLIPAAGLSALAKIQGWLHIVGGILFPAGVAIVIFKGSSFIAFPILGSLIACWQRPCSP